MWLPKIHKKYLIFKLGHALYLLLKYIEVYKERKLVIIFNTFYKTKLLTDMAEPVRKLSLQVEGFYILSKCPNLFFITKIVSESLVKTTTYYWEKSLFYFIIETIPTFFSFSNFEQFFFYLRKSGPDFVLRIEKQKRKTFFF